jgi:hypothetical protein
LQLSEKKFYTRKAIALAASTDASAVQDGALQDDVAASSTKMKRPLFVCLSVTRR